MTDLDSPYFFHPTDSGSFAERAQKQLQLFDTGNPESLFYAALELRMGIEARLLQVLRGLLRANNNPPEKIKEYSPNVLLGKIADLDENAFQPITLIFGKQGSQNRAVLQFIPVTKELASDYRKVGNLLHVTFFESNKDLFAKQRLWPEYNTGSLIDYRDILGDIAKPLEQASSGDLIAPPSFIKFFDELNTNERK
jgi:hypothetical protein